MARQPAPQARRGPLTAERLSAFVEGLSLSEEVALWDILAKRRSGLGWELRRAVASIVGGFRNATAPIVALGAELDRVNEHSTGKRPGLMGNSRVEAEARWLFARYVYDLAFAAMTRRRCTRAKTIARFIFEGLEKRYVVDTGRLAGLTRRVDLRDDDEIRRVKAALPEIVRLAVEDHRTANARAERIARGAVEVIAPDVRRTMRPGTFADRLKETPSPRVV